MIVQKTVDLNELGMSQLNLVGKAKIIFFLMIQKVIYTNYGIYIILLDLNVYLKIIMVKLINELENIIKYTFKDKSILQRVLTHKSFNNYKNNEKLEFLGDRVLGLVISKN